MTAPSTIGLNIVGLDGDSTTLSWQYSRQITAREADGSDFASVSWTLSDTTAFQFTTWGAGDLGTATFDKTVTGRTIVIEPKYDKGTATLTVKATRADGTVLTAQKTLVNTGGDSPDPADSLSLSGQGLAGSGASYTLTMNAEASTQLTTSVAPAKAPTSMSSGTRLPVTTRRWRPLMLTAKCTRTRLAPSNTSPTRRRVQCCSPSR